MKTVASDVRPAPTPSIGTGYASAIVVAAASASTPAITSASCSDPAKDTAATIVTASPASTTGRRIGSTLTISGGGRSLDRGGSAVCSGGGSGTGTSDGLL